MSMLRINDIRIPVRIAIATILPLLAFAGFAAKSLAEKWSASQAAGRVAVVTSCSGSGARRRRS
jgi:hypothetical protein